MSFRLMSWFARPKVASKPMPVEPVAPAQVPTVSQLYTQYPPRVARALSLAQKDRSPRG